jgi:hypothetical protein
MASSIIRTCGTFNVTPNASSPTFVTVGETSRSKRQRTPEEIAAVVPLARQIRPYLQEDPRPDTIPAHQRAPLTVDRLAEEMVSAKGWSVAYYGDVPEHILAFASLREIRPRPFERLRRVPTEYAFDQFGVTVNRNVRLAQNSPHVGACVALLSCAVQNLPPQSNVYVVGYPGDTRQGDIFREAGFLPNPDAPNWRADEATIMAVAGTVKERLAAHPAFAFPRRPEAS